MMAGFDTMHGGVSTSSSHWDLATFTVAISAYGRFPYQFFCLFFLFHLKCDFDFNN